MADHDRDAGSRGEEEAPRDPSPTEPTQELRSPGEEPGQLKYGEQADRAYAYIPPTVPDPAGWERESFSDFARRKRRQIIGAGLIGLVVGGLLGGLGVAAFSDDHDDHGRYGVWMRPDHPAHRDFMMPERLESGCYESEEDLYCVVPPPDRVLPAPAPDAPDAPDGENVAPRPVRTG
ncbi:hypothetical protein [Nonomuraea sp. KM90]